MPEAPAPTAEASPKADRDASDSIILIPFPKIVFLWPAFLVAVVAALYMHFTTGSTVAISDAGAGAVAMGWTFLIVLSLNLVVLSFDFPRTTSLTLFFVIVALVLGGALAIVYFPDVLPQVSERLAAIQPEANATFYYIFSGVMALIYLGVFLNTKMDYWEVRPNELLHHHGILSDLERFPAPHLRLDKEINDIFEYMLLGSGRLILHPSNERRAVVLDNVLWISSKERAITKMLGALQVQVRDQER
jgi:hypothetical protein